MSIPVSSSDFKQVTDEYPKWEAQTRLWCERNGIVEPCSKIECDICEEIIIESKQVEYDDVELNLCDECFENRWKGCRDRMQIWLDEHPTIQTFFFAAVMLGMVTVVMVVVISITYLVTGSVTGE